jgi:hypothetical protein
LESFFRDYQAAVDSWAMINNTIRRSENRIAWRHVGGRVVVTDNGLWTQLVNRYMKPRVEEPVTAPVERVEADVREAFDSERIRDAVNRAVTAALKRHKALGQSVVVWRDGKIVELKPEEIDV